MAVQDKQPLDILLSGLSAKDRTVLFQAIGVREVEFRRPFGASDPPTNGQLLADICRQWLAIIETPSGRNVVEELMRECSNNQHTGEVRCPECAARMKRRGSGYVCPQCNYPNKG